MPFPDASFDVVSDFGITRHVPVWQEAVGEIQKVLPAGGQSLLEQAPKHVLHYTLLCVFAEHPRENLFDGVDFRAQCERRGCEIGERFGNLRILILDAFSGAAVNAG
jgi:ubiquinone/menaquinone biosynthesis C-methylase UbiE